MVRAFSPHCPNCAAALRVDLAAGATVRCEYCDSTLILDLGRVQLDARPTGASAPTYKAPNLPPPIEPPKPALVARDAPRFAMRIVEQAGDGSEPEVFESLELSGDRFALVLLRCTDADGAVLDIDLTAAHEILAESLEDDGDPGLATNLALEEVSAEPGFVKLESFVLLLDPTRTTATIHSAGKSAVAHWLSTEEGRPITAGPNHPPLEKLHLAKAGDHFENGRVVQMAALDVLVVVSFRFMSDPAMLHGAGYVLGKVLRENVGEEPERLVTLVKNGWWENRAGHEGRDQPLASDLRIAAIGARLADPDPAFAASLEIEAHSTRAFEVAVQKGEHDRVVLRDIDGKRSMLLVASPDGDALGDEAFTALVDATFAVLADDSRGSFDNAREAGRTGLTAFAHAGGDPDAMALLVAHLSDEHRRAKYFCHREKRGVTLGARGTRPGHEQQQFDGGGEVTLHDHERLLLLGASEHEGDVIRAEELSARWPGGKSSHLFEAMRLHWRTRKAEKALRKMVGAAAADGTAARRMVLVQGKPVV